MESALIVRIPEADAIVAKWRERYDLAAADGIPAHITVIYPFIPTHLITNEVEDEVKKILETVRPFDFEFSETGWFGESVLFLKPSNSGRFAALIKLMASKFPEYQPYEGAFDSIVPHLTIGDKATYAELQEAENDIKAHLPIKCRAEEVHWMQGDGVGAQWTTRAIYRLESVRPHQVSSDATLSSDMGGVSLS